MIIDTNKLDKYELPKWYTEDKLTETIDKKYSIYAYNIDEYRMCAYSCNMAIYKNDFSDRPLLNSAKIYLDFIGRQFYTYLPIANLFIFIMLAYRKNSEKPGYPYLIINPDTQRFTFIEWDFTSVYYKFEEENDGTIVLREQNINELNSGKIVKRTGERFNPLTFHWFDFGQFANAIELYFNS
jgi:hypothetical protein